MSKPKKIRVVVEIETYEDDGFRNKKEAAEHLASCINGQDFATCCVFYRGEEL